MLSLRSSFASFATLLALVSLAGCSSSKQDDPDPHAAHEMSWTVDGAAVKTSTLQSQNISGTLSIAGTVPAGATPIYLSLQFPNAVGTYAFSTTPSAGAAYTASTGSTAAVYYAGAWGQGTLMGAGTVVVTALTTTEVVGTFAFTGLNPNTGASKSISNGKFSVGL